MRNHKWKIWAMALVVAVLLPATMFADNSTLTFTETNVTIDITTVQNIPVNDDAGAFTITNVANIDNPIYQAIAIDPIRNDDVGAFTLTNVVDVSTLDANAGAGKTVVLPPIGSNIILGADNTHSPTALANGCVSPDEAVVKPKQTANPAPATTKTMNYRG